MKEVKEKLLSLLNSSSPANKLLAIIQAEAQGIDIRQDCAWKLVWDIDFGEEAGTIVEDYIFYSEVTKESEGVYLVEGHVKWNQKNAFRYIERLDANTQEKSIYEWAKIFYEAKLVS